MHYLIYKTINLVNGKYYIGKHKTKIRDDDYLGSGKLLRAAIRKYGRENFIREIILECSDEEEMNLAEKILVVPDLDVNYNLCPGGYGGFGYINDNNLWDTEKRRDAARKNIRKVDHLSRTAEAQIKRLATFKKNFKEGKFLNFGKGFQNKTHTTESRELMSIAASKRTGSKNSQFGTCWMTNGAKNIKIKRDEVDRWIELGYKQGRI